MQLAIVFLDLRHNLSIGNLTVGASQCKVGISRLIGIRVNRACILELFIADVRDIVGRFGEPTTIGFIIDLLFINNADTMVIIEAPDILLVVLNKTVVVTRLGCAIMDAHTMQVVGNALKRRVLGLQQVLLGLNLLLKRRNLLLDLGAVGVKHLLYYA